MRPSEFESLRKYVGFDEEAAAALREFHPLAQPHLRAIIDDFYEAIARDEAASAVITGGSAQITRLKQTLLRWLDSVLLGPHDAAFLEAHTRIGTVHVRIRLPEPLMFAAMNRIRSLLLELAVAAPWEPEQKTTLVRAINQVLDLELAILVETYRTHMEDKLRASERLATIGQLSASIGHELRNPLGIMESSLFIARQRLEKKAPSDAQVVKHLDRIGQQIRVCGKTITDLLELARSRPPRKIWVLVKDLLEKALDGLAIPDTVVVQSDPSPNLRLHGDPDQLRQVLTNLLSNAVQAMRGRGTIIVAGEWERGGMSVRVRDDGPGIPLGDRVHVFDALFTTKAKGTGLGLALCRRILEAHGGEIVLEPSDVGASFRFWVPDPAFGYEQTAADQQ